MEDEELEALPHPSASLNSEYRGSRTRDPILLPLPGPLFMEGLADAALEDGECLLALTVSPQCPSGLAVSTGRYPTRPAQRLSLSCAPGEKDAERLLFLSPCPGLHPTPQLVGQGPPAPPCDCRGSVTRSGVGEGSRSPHLLCTPPPAMARCVFLCPGSHHPASPPVENLRHLILWSLLPAHPADPRAAGEPEDDLTPTPSVISITSHPWDPGSPGRAPAGAEGDDAPLSGPEWSQPAQEDMALRSLEQLPPRTRNSGVWESPKLDKNPEEEASSTEGTGSYKVVRKGKVSWGAPRGARSLPAGCFLPAPSGSPVCRGLSGSRGRRHADIM